MSTFHLIEAFDRSYVRMSPRSLVCGHASYVYGVAGITSESVVRWDHVRIHGMARVLRIVAVIPVTLAFGLSNKRRKKNIKATLARNAKILSRSVIVFLFTTIGIRAGLGPVHVVMSMKPRGGSGSKSQSPKGKGGASQTPSPSRR